MENSKVFTLLKGVTLSELKVLTQQIKTHKRKTLTKLFAVLSNNRTTYEPDSSKIFKSVFGKSYSKASDYLLRNEYRLLYHWLAEHLTVESGGRSSENSLAFLQYLLNRTLYDLFEEDYKLAWKKAVQDDNTIHMLSLSDLNIRFHLQGKPQTLANAKITAELVGQRINILKQNVLRQIREEEVRLRMSERIISAYMPNEKLTSTTQHVNLEELEKDDLYAQYLSLRAMINASKGEAKIQHLNKIVQLEEVIKKYEPNPSEAMNRFWINLGQEHYLCKNYIQAVEYYSKAEDCIEILPLHLQESFVLNFTMALMRAEQFERAQKLAISYEKELLNSKLLAGRGPFLLSVLHLYVRNADNAEKYVTLETKKEGSEFYFFMRLVLSAVYYLRGNLDLALRESINVDQAINYELNHEQTLQTKISKPIVSVFRRFYSTLQRSTEAERDKQLRLLLTEIIELTTAGGEQSPNSVLTQWITREMNILIERKTNRKR